MREVLWSPCASALSSMKPTTRSTAPSDALDNGLWASSGFDITAHKIPDPQNADVLHTVTHYEYASHLLPFDCCPACDTPIRDFKIALMTKKHFVYPCEDCDQFVWVGVINSDYA